MWKATTVSSAVIQYVQDVHVAVLGELINDTVKLNVLIELGVPQI